MQLDTNFYCFDCDGVLWRGKDPIPEARDVIIKLKQSVNTNLMIYFQVLTFAFKG